MFQKITLFCGLLVSATSCLADIRPEGSVGQSPSAAQVRRGRELLQGAVEKWGGARRWPQADRKLEKNESWRNSRSRDPI